MSQRRSPVFGLSLLLILLQASPAIATTIDFEGFVDSTQLVNQIPGLTFANATVLTAGISLNEFEFPPRSGQNAVFDDGGSLGIVFATPQARVAGHFTYLQPLTFTAFDAAQNPVGSTHSAFSSNLALSGVPGSSPNEQLALAFPAGIRSVTIVADPLGSSFTLDDLTPSPVPEPSTLLLLGSSLAGTITWLRVRRRRKVKPASD